jgi:hypothetical protein
LSSAASELGALNSGVTAAVLHALINATCPEVPAEPALVFLDATTTHPILEAQLPAYLIINTAMASTAHQYPGINLPLRYIRQEGEAGIGFYRLGSFDGVDCDSELIQVREVFMMILMDRLTDKPNWHEKVFDDAIVAKWRDEALTQREGGIYYHIVDGKHVPKPKRTRFMTGEAFDYVRLLSGVDLRYRISTD